MSPHRFAWKGNTHELARLLQMATGAPPNAELHPMRALFLIPKDPPPRLEGDFSPAFQRFVERCLQKVLSCCKVAAHGSPTSATCATLRVWWMSMFRRCLGHAARF